MAVQVLRGTWEEITGHASELAGKTIQLTVLTETAENATSVADETRAALRRIMSRQAAVRDTDPPTFVYRNEPTRG